jgi:hypothetical protein
MVISRMGNFTSATSLIFLKCAFSTTVTRYREFEDAINRRTAAFNKSPISGNYVFHGIQQTDYSRSD